jgi:hypothetical protein
MDAQYEDEKKKGRKYEPKAPLCVEQAIWVD